MFCIDFEGMLCVLVFYVIGLFQFELVFVEFCWCYLLVQLVLIYDNSLFDFVEYGFDVVLCVGLLNDLGYVVCLFGWLYVKFVVSLVYLDCIGWLCMLDDFV